MNFVRGFLSSAAWRFLVTGGLAYLVDTGALLSLHELANWPLPWATTGAYVGAFALTFMLNRTWVFDAPSGAMGPQLVRYLILVGLNYLLTLLLVLGLAALGLPVVVAKTISVAVIAVLNFFAYRSFVFAD